MKSQSLRNSTKKSLIFFKRDVRAFHEVPLTPIVFRHATSRKTENHSHPMPDVIIEQPPVQNHSQRKPRKYKIVI